MTENLITERQAAEKLMVSVKQVRALTDAGDLPYINVGMGKLRERRRYSADDLRSFIDNRRKVATPQSSKASHQRRQPVIDLNDFRNRISERLS